MPMLTRPLSRSTSDAGDIHFIPLSAPVSHPYPGKESSQPFRFNSPCIGAFANGEVAWMRLRGKKVVWMAAVATVPVTVTTAAGTRSLQQQRWCSWPRWWSERRSWRCEQCVAYNQQQQAQYDDSQSSDTRISFVVTRAATTTNHSRKASWSSFKPCIDPHLRSNHFSNRVRRDGSSSRCFFLKAPGARCSLENHEAFGLSKLVRHCAAFESRNRDEFQKREDGKVALSLLNYSDDGSMNPLLERNVLKGIAVAIVDCGCNEPELSPYLETKSSSSSLGSKQISMKIGEYHALYDQGVLDSKSEDHDDERQKRDRRVCHDAAVESKASGGSITAMVRCMSLLIGAKKTAEESELLDDTAIDSQQIIDAAQDAIGKGSSSLKPNDVSLLFDGIRRYDPAMDTAEILHRLITGFAPLPACVVPERGNVSDGESRLCCDHRCKHMLIVQDSQCADAVAPTNMYCPSRLCTVSNCKYPRTSVRDIPRWNARGSEKYGARCKSLAMSLNILNCSDHIAHMPKKKNRDAFDFLSEEDDFESDWISQQDETRPRKCLSKNAKGKPCGSPPLPGHQCCSTHRSKAAIDEAKPSTGSAAANGGSSIIELLHKSSILEDTLPPPLALPTVLASVVQECKRSLLVRRSKGCGHEIRMGCGKAMKLLQPDGRTQAPPFVERVTKSLAHCGHEVEVQCSRDISTMKCDRMTDKECWNFKICKGTVPGRCSSSSSAAHCETETAWSCSNGHNFQMQQCKQGIPEQCPSCSFWGNRDEPRRPRDLDEMLDRNAGLKSRFTRFVDFYDWETEDCLKVTVAKSENDGRTLSPDATESLRRTLDTVRSLPMFGSGRDVVQLWSEMLDCRAQRVQFMPEIVKAISVEDAAGQTFITGRKPAFRPLMLRLRRQVAMDRDFAHAPTQRRLTDHQESKASEEHPPAMEKEETAEEEDKWSDAERDPGVSDDTWAELQLAKQEHAVSNAEVEKYLTH
ncbi:hypothetical protein FI667_g6996, partial [Globisporangium splendens]